MAFSYFRTVHFPDTDAAGVVFFPNYLAICHEAYEEALAAAGLDTRAFFSDRDGLVVPIAKSEASYLRPLVAGDKLRVTVSPETLTPHSYALHFELWKLAPAAPSPAGEKLAARVRTEHVCIATATRGRQPLPAPLAAWIAAAATATATDARTT